MNIIKMVELKSGSSHQWNDSVFNLSNESPSQVIDVGRIEHVSAQFTLSGSLVTGSLSLQVSNDSGHVFRLSGYRQDVATSSIGTWQDITAPVSTVTAVSHSVGSEVQSYFFNVPELGFRWLRAYWAPASGCEGSLSGSVTLKG